MAQVDKRQFRLHKEKILEIRTLIESDADKKIPASFKNHLALYRKSASRLLLHENVNNFKLG